MITTITTHYHSIKPKLKYNEIFSVVSTHHNRRLTPNRLKQICKLEGLTRRRNVTEDQLYDIIVSELGTSLHTVGYRQMTENVYIKYKINVSKENVRKVVKIVERKKKENETALNEGSIELKAQPSFTTSMEMTN